MAITVDGRSVKMYGALLATLADTLGAHQLGGFKVGVGFALRICRTCMATKEINKNQVHQNLEVACTDSHDTQ